MKKRDTMIITKIERKYCENRQRAIKYLLSACAKFNQSKLLFSQVQDITIAISFILDADIKLVPDALHHIDRICIVEDNGRTHTDLFICDSYAGPEYLGGEL